MRVAQGDPPQVIYGIDDRPPLREAVPLGFQHVVAMLLGNITPPLLITGALGLAVAIGLGLGIELRPEVLQHLPDFLQTFFGSGLITGGLTALMLNLLLPGSPPQDARGIV